MKSYGNSLSSYEIIEKSSSASYKFHTCFFQKKENITTHYVINFKRYLFLGLHLWQKAKNAIKESKEEKKVLKRSNKG